MSYIKTNWVDNATPLNAINLNNIEGGISYNEENLTAHSTLATAHGAVATSTASTIALRDASGNLVAKQLKSDIAIGTAPLTVVSTTIVPNLNADMLDGLHSTDFARYEKYYARAYQSTPQTVIAVTATKILFQAKSYDSQSEFDTTLSRYVSKTAGIISVNAAVSWGGAQVDANATAVYIYKNGVRYSEIDFRRTGSGGVSQSAGNGNVQVAINDYIEIFAYTAQQLATVITDTWAEFCKIA